MHHLADLLRKASVLLRRPFIFAFSVAFVIVINVNIRHAAPDSAVDPDLSQHTEIAHREAIALEDLSQLRLNADTSISINETPQTRKVVLKKGELLAVVKHNDARPFEIIVQHAVLADLGTMFNVDAHDGVTNVAVIEGKIRVYEQKDNGGRLDPLVETPEGYRRGPAYLEIGDISRVEERGDGSVLVRREGRDLTEAKARTSWLRGELNVTTERLDEVVAEFNRYHAERLIITDENIAKIKALPGHYSLSDLQAFRGSLLQLGLQADPLPGTQGTAHPQDYLVRRISHVGRDVHNERDRSRKKTSSP